MLAIFVEIDIVAFSKYKSSHSVDRTMHQWRIHISIGLFGDTLYKDLDKVIRQIVYNINKIMLNAKTIIMTSYFHNGAKNCFF